MRDSSEDLGNAKADQIAQGSSNATRRSVQKLIDSKEPVLTFSNAFTLVLQYMKLYAQTNEAGARKTNQALAVPSCQPGDDRLNTQNERMKR